MNPGLPLTKKNYPGLLIYKGWFWWQKFPGRQFFAAQNPVDWWAQDPIGPFLSLKALKLHIDGLPKN